MAAILVATNFTPTGDNAVHYAAALAQRQACSLTVLHAYYVPVTFNDPAMPILPVDELTSRNKKRMEGIARSLAELFPDLEVHTRVEYGDIQDILEDLIEAEPPSMIVIGSHADEEDTFWTGNTATELLRTSKIPVLAVPHEYAYRPVQKICVAIDADGLTADSGGDALAALLLAHQANLHLLHVVPKAEAALDQLPSLPLPTFAEGTDVRLHLTDAGDDLNEAIADFTRAHDIDWLAIIPHQYSFWESLFHKSHTKAMVHKSGIPLLALH